MSVVRVSSALLICDSSLFVYGRVFPILVTTILGVVLGVGS